MDILEPGHTRRNLKTLETAISRGFEIPENVLKTAPKVMGHIIATGSTREKIAAGRVLVAMVRASQPTTHLHAHAHAQDAPIVLEGETFEQRRERLRRRLRNAAESGGD